MFSVPVITQNAAASADEDEFRSPVSERLQDVVDVLVQERHKRARSGPGTSQTCAPYRNKRVSRLKTSQLAGFGV